MAEFRVKHRRQDGTFVVELETRERGFLPYHVIPSDPLFPSVAAAAQRAGELAPEPRPVAQPASRHILPLAFMDRVSRETQATITHAALSDADIMLWLLRLMAAHHVDLDDAETKRGVDALVSAGLLTERQASALLA